MVASAYGGAGAPIVNYSTDEHETGELWTGGETVFRKIITIGTLPNATLKNVAHGITNLDVVISLKGVAKNVSGATSVQMGRPTSDGNSQITINVNATNVQVVTAADLTANTLCHVELIYTKTS